MTPGTFTMGRVFIYWTLDPVAELYRMCTIPENRNGENPDMGLTMRADRVVMCDPDGSVYVIKERSQSPAAMDDYV